MVAMPISSDLLSCEPRGYVWDPTGMCVGLEEFSCRFFSMDAGQRGCTWMWLALPFPSVCSVVEMRGIR